MSISNPEIKKLYGLSAGRCNICKVNLFEHDVHIGEMAHIIAKSKKGPRGDEDIDIDAINTYNNLILLCCNHHTTVDNAPLQYPTERVHSIKKEHEYIVSSLFDAPKEMINDTFVLQLFMKHVKFTKLKAYVNELPYKINLDFISASGVIDEIELHYPHMYPVNDIHLQNKITNFKQIMDALWSDISANSLFEGKYYTNFSQSDDNFCIHLQKGNLPYQVTSVLVEKLEFLANVFNEKYDDFNNYLRANYKSVNLNSYEQ